MLPINTAPIWGVDSSNIAQVDDVLGTDGVTVTDGAVTVLGAVGVNNANNAFASTAITANIDGSVLERLENLEMAHPRVVIKADGAVINAGGGDPIFDITGGPVRCKITGLVTTIIGGAANMSLTEATLAPVATVNLNAAPVAVDNDAVGTFYRNVGATSVFTPSAGLGFVISDPVTVEETDLILSPGTVRALGSAPQTGVIAWYMTYWPLSPASRVVASA